MDLAFTPEEQKFAAEVRAFVKANLPANQWVAGISAFTSLFAVGQLVGPAITGLAASNGSVTLSGVSNAGAQISVYDGNTWLGYAKTGSDGMGLRWAEALGHTVHALYASVNRMPSRAIRSIWGV